jgi:NADH-quinone oxidoreductase subunit N
MTLQETLAALLPVITLSACALLMMLVDAFLAGRRTVSFEIGVAGFLVAITAAVYNFSWVGVAPGGMVMYGGYANFFAALFCAGGIISFFFARSYLRNEQINHAEFYALLMFATVGMMLMAAAKDMIILFIGLEMMSLCFYILAGFARQRVTSNEAGLKYFLLGAFATGFFLYGVALVYGTTGATNFDAIRTVLSSVSHQQLFWLGGALIFIAFAFKVAAVPFHMWAPDVYEGAPTVISGWMSAVGKAASFSAIVLIAVHVFGVNDPKFRMIVAVISAVTMLYGNIAALSQQSIKRMLAYSSVAHAGYILTGIAAGSAMGYGAALYYAAVYVFMQTGAFGIAGELERNGNTGAIAEFAGLGTRKPLVAALFSIFLFSLAGIPPLGGFFGKYYLFASAVQNGMTWLAIIGVVASIISMYFYIGIIIKMYFQESQLAEPVSVSGTGAVALWLSSGAVLILGILPNPLVTMIQRIF